MTRLRATLAACLVIATLTPALAGPNHCLSPDERRAKIATHQVVPLSKAMRAAKVGRRELVRASLCERNDRLVYLLTVLGRDGKVTRATVDAGSGTVVAGH